MPTQFSFDNDKSLENIMVAVIEAQDVAWEPYSFKQVFQDELQRCLASGESLVSPSRKKAVRDMLRYGSYKPAGRAKPSSEYLLQAMLEGDFPKVNYFVDTANLVSLAAGYPISIIDLDKAGSDLLLRRGRAGDAYIFNAGGQEIDVTDLLCVYRKAGTDWIPTANPVRDSMATKIFEEARNLLAVIYAPGGSEGADLPAAAERLAGFLKARAGRVTAEILKFE